MRSVVVEPGLGRQCELPGGMASIVRRQWDGEKNATAQPSSPFFFRILAYRMVLLTLSGSPRPLENLSRNTHLAIARGVLPW